MISVNLLPEDIRENIAYSKKNKKTLMYVRMLIVFCLLLVISFGVCFYFQYLTNNYYLKSIKETEVIIAGYKEDFDNAKKLQEKIKTIETIKKNYKYWSKVNYALSKITPEGLYISEITVEETVKAANAKVEENPDAKKNIKITGFSKGKNEVGIFRDSMENLDGFSMVGIASIKEERDDKGVLKNKFIINVQVDKNATEKGKVK